VRTFVVLLSVVMFWSILYATSTTAKIKNSKNTLFSVTSGKKKMSRHLHQIAKDIERTNVQVEQLEDKLEGLESDEIARKERFTHLQKELQTYEESFTQSSQSLKKTEKLFIQRLSKHFSLGVAIEHAHEPTRDSILSYEVYDVYKKLNTDLLKSLKEEIQSLKQRKENALIERRRAQFELETIAKKRIYYSKQKEKKEHLRKSLEEDEERYSSKIQKMEQKQSQLRTTLANLNIIHKKELIAAEKAVKARQKAMRLAKEEKRRLAKAKAVAREKARLAKEALKKATTKEQKEKAQIASIEAQKESQSIAIKRTKVRQIHSSYTKPKTYKYRGKKTISPLHKARVIKKYGTYTDPIYKMKIFNESVTLKSASDNAKVHNVLNGKVVFAGKSSMLGKVVVVSHSGKIHTIYAGLSKIAPTISVGSKIKKGYVVGKIHRKLIFQVTKNSKYINPMRLIKS